MNVSLGVTNPASGAAATVGALMDLDALLRAVPVRLLIQLGIVPVRRRCFEQPGGLTTNFAGTTAAGSPRRDLLSRSPQ